jgi:hypothetical protein
VRWALQDATRAARLLAHRKSDVGMSMRGVREVGARRSESSIEPVPLIQDDAGSRRRGLGGMSQDSLSQGQALRSSSQNCLLVSMTVRVYFFELGVLSACYLCKSRASLW